MTPDVKAPKPPPNTPTKADPSVQLSGRGQENIGFMSLISTAVSGLKKKASTSGKSLLGGASSQWLKGTAIQTARSATG